MIKEYYSAWTSLNILLREVAMLTSLKPSDSNCRL